VDSKDSKAYKDLGFRVIKVLLVDKELKGFKA
jgi:hypothetical protein